MAIGFNPYSIAGTRGDLMSLTEETGFKGKLSDFETKAQKGVLMDEFYAEIQKAQNEALKRSEKHKGLRAAFNVLGAATGGIGGSILGGLSGYLGGKDAQKGAKLLSGVDTERWGKTFLRGDAADWDTQAEEAQRDDTDVWSSALGQGLTIGSLGDMLAGDAGTLFGNLKGDEGLFDILKSSLTSKNMKETAMIPALIQMLFK
tara:strand:+ start:326 stop:934 length:609 start_codon:yes stop_codon:yes gene_type:complete